MNRAIVNYGQAVRRAPIRVAYVVHTFDMGGLERCVARLVNHLDRDRFRPMIICLDRNGAAADWIKRDDASIVELRNRDGNDFGLLGRLAKVLKSHRVDIVHSHNWGTLVETTLARRWARVPVHLHAERGTLLNDLDHRGLRSRLRAVAARWAMNRADCVVTVAESLKEKLLARCGRLRPPIHVIPNGVDAPAVTKSEAELAELRQSLGIPAEATVLGSVGRLVAVKDFGNAIDAVSQLRQDGRNAHLLLVGGGPERERLAARARDQGVRACVHLIGQKEDVGNWLRMMDIYLNVSRSEGMSQSILEAMAAGLPLVVTDVGDSAILVNGDCPCGLVIPPGRPATLATAVAELSGSLERRATFSQNARTRHVGCYSTDTMVRAYGRLYFELIASRQV